MAQEIAWLGHDNAIDLLIKENGTVISLNPVTRMTLSLGTIILESTNNATHAILWAKAGYVTGECRIYINNTTKVIPAGVYDAPLVVCNSTATAGIVWGSVPLIVKTDPEAV